MGNAWARKGLVLRYENFLVIWGLFVPSGVGIG